MNISYSAFRQNLKKNIDSIVDKHEPLFITFSNVRKAVVLSYEDYESFAETAYLLQNPVMASRLLKSIEEVKEGKVEEHGLIDEV
jgi:antitoxin YefM